VLRGLLAEAADAAPPPGAPPQDLFAELSGEEAPEPPVAAVAPRGRSVRVLAIAAAAVVAVGIGAVVVAGDDGGHTVDQVAAPTTIAPTEEAVPPDAFRPVSPDQLGAAGSGTGGDAAPAPDVDSSGAGSSGSDRSATSGSGSTASGSGPTDSALVVKTGSMSLEVAKGAYDRTVDVVSTKAAGLGGYVSDSASNRDGGHASGQLTVRVPADRFEAFLSDLRRLGDVVAEDSQGADVGGQHADLQARLDALRATRDKLGTILAQAKTVDETLAVQDRITGVQTQVEQLEGQLRVLDDQVAMSSVTLDVTEPGADQFTSANPDDRDLGGAWADARHHFGDGVEDLVSWSGSAAVVLIVGLLLLGLGRLAWPRLRRFRI
jgi:hypothetical protein